VSGLSQFSKLETLIAQDPKLIFTLTSYVLILIIYINLNVFQSSFLGLGVSIFYFLINAIFLERAFFQKETAFFRLMFGILLFIMLLGFISWVFIIVYNLDVIRLTLVLFIGATVASLLNRKVKTSNVA